MPKPIQWIKFNRLMTRLNFDEYELHQIIDNQLLPAYVDYSNYNRLPDSIQPILINSLKVERDIRNHEIVFNLDDVIRYEKNNPNEKPPTIQNSEERLQDCLRQLHEEGVQFNKYAEILAHPAIEKILGQQNLSVGGKARQYLRPVVQEFYPHIFKGGRPKGS